MITDVLQISEEEDAGKLEEANNMVLREAQTRRIAHDLQAEDETLQGEQLWAAAAAKYHAMPGADMW